MFTISVETEVNSRQKNIENEDRDKGKILSRQVI